MKKLLRSLYSRLPLIRDLKRNECALQLVAQRLGGLHYDMRLLKMASMIQALETIKASDERYRDPRRLLVHGAQYWSQNYEDGMIAEIFRRVPPQTNTFVEIGVGDGAENNTTALLVQGWSGWWFEGGPDLVSSIKERLKTMPSFAQRLRVRQAMVTPEGIAGLFHDEGVPEEVDFFSLDIDQDTYHIWAALQNFRPRVVVVEYNGGIPPWHSWISPYLPNKMWDGTQNFGASLKAFELLGTKYRYSLVGCDVTGTNAFFVRNDLLGDKFSQPFNAENHYEPPRYYLLYRWGYPSHFFGETHQPA